MNKKIFITASTESHLKHFHQPYIRAFEQEGWEVIAKALPVSKRFFSLKNLRAIWSTSRFIQEEDFTVISTHTTLAGIVARLAVLINKKNRQSVLVFHTMHGYLFRDDQRLKKWVYLIPEILCAAVTDVLMVMNREDLAIAQKYRLCKNREHIYCTNGMGIDLSRFYAIEADAETRKAFGLKEGDFTLVYAAEFSKRKNHRLLLRGFAKALQELQVQESQRLQKSQQLQEPQGLQNSNGIPEVVSSSCSRLRLALAGDGALQDEMKALANDLGISDQVNFLGYVTDMQVLYSCCQAAVSTSRIEGLPFHVMEAIGCGLPVIASNIKGHRELITHQENGLLFEGENTEQLASMILELYHDPVVLEVCKVNGFSSMKAYSIDNALPSIMQIYHKHISTWGGMKE